MGKHSSAVAFYRPHRRAEARRFLVVQPIGALRAFSRGCGAFALVGKLRGLQTAPGARLKHAAPVFCPLLFARSTKQRHS